MAGTVTKVRDYRILLLRTSYNIIYDGKKVVAARRNEVWTLIFNLPARAIPQLQSCNLSELIKSIFLIHGKKFKANLHFLHRL